MSKIKKKKTSGLPEWAHRITALRGRLEISQGELAKRMECFPLGTRFTGAVGGILRTTG